MSARRYPVHHQWDPSKPIGANTTAVILPGRGETAHSYHRLAARLAYDTFDVHVLDRDQANAGPQAVIAEVEASAKEGGARHLILIGHDSGANLALNVALGLRAKLTALVLSSPTTATLAAGIDWETELVQRSGCSAYKGEMKADPGVQPGALSQPPGALPPDAAALAAITAPVLLLTGEDDLALDRELIASLVRHLPSLVHVQVRAGKHDVLNDRTSRSVSGEIVKFAEWARSGDPGSPLLQYLTPLSPYVHSPETDPVAALG